MDNKIIRIQQDYNENLTDVNKRSENVISEMQWSLERERQALNNKINIATEEKQSYELQIRDLSIRHSQLEQINRQIKEELQSIKRKVEINEERFKEERSDLLRKSQHDIVKKLFRNFNNFFFVNEKCLSFPLNIFFHFYLLARAQPKA